jgi:hypothetical protein
LVGPIRRGCSALSEGSNDRPSRLTVNERLTFLVGAGSMIVGVGSLIVSFLTYRNAADTTELKAAIGNLSDLATQTKRQADGTHEQLAAVREQVSALRDQAQEAKRQTAAIASQTEAIKVSSEAAVRSADANISAANAQRRMAEVTAQAQRPDIDLTDLTISGLNEEPNKDGFIMPLVTWKFRDYGGSPVTVKDVVLGYWVAAALPEKMPEGTSIDGAETVISNVSTSAFFPAVPIYFTVSKEQKDAIDKGGSNIFFFARFEYVDNMKEEHYRCFGRKFILRDGASNFAVPSGGPAYQCAG